MEKVSTLHRVLVQLIIAAHYWLWQWIIWVILVAVLLWRNPLGWTRWAAAAYLAWIFVWQGSHATKQRYWTGLRRWSGWRMVANYFPAQLHKTEELDPSGSYLFAYHPHGIISFSAWLAFATEATGFSAKFPGLRMNVLTLATNLRMPFLREYLLLHGLQDVNRSTCINILSRGKGESIMLAIGGADEALHAAPGTCDLVLKRRKGFVRVAVQTGASLVPVIAFGENDMYNTVRGKPGSRLSRFQEWLEHVAGFTLPIFWGDDILLPFGLLPKRVPLNVVVGEPLPVKRFEADIRSEEGRQVVDAYHEKYIQALTALWDKYKDKYAPNRKSDLRLVE